MIEIKVEVDEELKKLAEKILQDKYGLSLEQACIVFLEECVRCKKIPFEIEYDPESVVVPPFERLPEGSCPNVHTLLTPEKEKQQSQKIRAILKRQRD